MCKNNKPTVLGKRQPLFFFELVRRRCTSTPAPSAQFTPSDSASHRLSKSPSGQPLEVACTDLDSGALCVSPHVQQVKQACTEAEWEWDDLDKMASAISSFESAHVYICSTCAVPWRYPSNVTWCPMHRSVHIHKVKALLCPHSHQPGRAPMSTPPSPALTNGP